MIKTALLFAGQGAQFVGMGADLADAHPVAAGLFSAANKRLGYDLAKLCRQGPEEELTRTDHAQPGIYLAGWISYAVLREAVPGLQVQAAAGLSLGEFTALAAAGVFAFEDGLELVSRRGKLMQAACESTRGGMAAVIGLEEAPTRQVCAEAGVEIANLNCPGQIVISGLADRLEEACELARSRGARKAMLLNVAGAYHSRLMAGAQPGLRDALLGVSPRPPGIRVYSNVTARPHDEATRLRQLLVDQVISPVRWEETVRHLIAEGFTRFIELGPGRVLSGFTRRIDPSVRMLNVGDVPSLEATVRALKDGSGE